MGKTNIGEQTQKQGSHREGVAAAEVQDAILQHGRVPV